MKSGMFNIILALAGWTAVQPAHAIAQDIPAATASAPATGTASADVRSIDAIVTAVYEVISGDAGVKRDWNRFRSLFHSDARMIPTGTGPDGKTVTARVATPEDYIARGGPLLEKDGFHERELFRRVERFGNIAHVFSTYEGRRKRDDPQPFVRGINSIQLLFDGTRWWVLNVAWSPETTAHPIPAHYLPRS